ncbi:hypothetical protein [Rhodobacter sp. NSM]|uniref:hypothetical protein n=1 Tax=Rhodobacter sp. NSM TaxID=3457501 RepID=UPI003FD50BD3
MATESEFGHAAPSWFTAPGETDFLAWVTVFLIILALFGLITLYAAFDRWAEHKSSGTPLAKTIPTLLTIALVYEIFPLDHVSALLPLSAILIALAADWSRFHLVGPLDTAPGHTATQTGGRPAERTDAEGEPEHA